MQRCDRKAMPGPLKTSTDSASVPKPSRNAVTVSRSRFKSCRHAFPATRSRRSVEKCHLSGEYSRRPRALNGSRGGVFDAVNRSKDIRKRAIDHVTVGNGHAQLSLRSTTSRRSCRHRHATCAFPGTPETGVWGRSPSPSCPTHEETCTREEHPSET
jgi:hypothetical protein